MKTVIEKVRTMLRHNQFLAMAVVVVLVLGAWLIGCESTVQSPFNPDKQVTRAQLQNDWEGYAKDMELAITDLDKQDLFKQKLFELGVVFAQGGTVNPLGAGITLLGILGLGAAGDNLKKDSIIKTLQNSKA